MIAGMQGAVQRKCTNVGTVEIAESFIRAGLGSAKDQERRGKEKKLLAMLNKLLAPSGNCSAIEPGFRIHNWRIIVLCGRDCLYLCALYDAKHMLSPKKQYVLLFIYLFVAPVGIIIC